MPGQWATRNPLAFFPPRCTRRVNPLNSFTCLATQVVAWLGNVPLEMQMWWWGSRQAFTNSTWRPSHWLSSFFLKIWRTSSLWHILYVSLKIFVFLISYVASSKLKKQLVSTNLSWNDISSPSLVQRKESWRSTQRAAKSILLTTFLSTMISHLRKGRSELLLFLPRSKTMRKGRRRLGELMKNASIWWRFVSPFPLEWAVSELESQLCIVRVMKNRKTMTHNDLVNEVASQLSSKFQPEPLVIKKRIEHLIDVCLFRASIK